MKWPLENCLMIEDKTKEISTMKEVWKFILIIINWVILALKLSKSYEWFRQLYQTLEFHAIS